MRIDIGEIVILLISGTASIGDKGETSTLETFGPNPGARSATSPTCFPLKVRPGRTSFARLVICGTLTATTRNSTKSAPHSTSSRARPAAGFDWNSGQALQAELLVEIEAIAMFRQTTRGSDLKCTDSLGRAHSAVRVGRMGADRQQLPLRQQSSHTPGEAHNGTIRWRTGGPASLFKFC